MHDVSVVWYDRPGPGKFLTASQVSLMAGFKIPVQLTIRVLSDNTQAWEKKNQNSLYLGTNSSPQLADMGDQARLDQRRSKLSFGQYGD